MKENIEDLVRNYINEKHNGNRAEFARECVEEAGMPFCNSIYSGIKAHMTGAKISKPYELAYRLYIKSKTEIETNIKNKTDIKK